MSQQIIVEFDSDYVFKRENDDIPAGQELSSVVQRELVDQGKTVTEVRQRSFYGWEFTVIYETFKIRVVLQQGKRWLFAIGEERPLLVRMFQWTSQSPALLQLAATLRDILESKGFGKSVCVLTESDFARQQRQ